MKVLWLVSLYPSKISPYDGDFIQRHAQATSLFCEIEVLHIVKDECGVVTHDVREEVIVSGQLTERIIYYKPGKTHILFFDRLISSLKYKKLSRAAVKKYISENGKPVFLHLHVAMKAGLTALWVKRKFNIPYLLTEHWGGYLDEAVPNIRNYNAVYHYYWNKIIINAKASTYVSVYLKKLIERKYPVQNTSVIPNVVNTAIFYPVEKKPTEKVRFIHVSTMVYQKNPEAIFQALALLKDEADFDMYVYGPVSEPQIELVQKLGLKDNILFKGEAPQQELAKTMQQCDALILYSRFETFGCVLIEANACGVPVIVSDLAVFHEIVKDGVNGIFAEVEQAESLAEKLRQFIAEKNNFDKNAIAAAAKERYNYLQVGSQFLNWYKNICN